MHKTLLVLAVSLVSGILPSSFVIAGSAPAMVAESATAQDRANLQVVKSFMAAWKDAGHGSDYLAPNASITLQESGPPLVGKKAWLDRWAALESGQTVSAKLRGLYSRGPVVVALHTDNLATPGKPDQIYNDVGVFILKDGKILQWTDYEWTDAPRGPERH